MRKIYTAMLALLLMHPASAQDPNFSQFFVSPLTLNPALTGKFNGDFRIAGNYRDQWPAISSAFITTTISFDLPILRSKLSDLDTWGVGLVAMTDKTANGILNTNMISLSTAYHKGLDVDGLHQIGFGFQGSYFTKRLDGTKLNFESELDPHGGWTLPSGETMDGRQFNINYFDLSAGMLYNGSTDGYNNFYFGVAGYHLNQPRESFGEDKVDYTLKTRVTAHAGGSFPVAGNHNRNIYLSALYTRQNKAVNVVGGAVIGLTVNNDEERPTTFYAGLFSRFNNQNDAAIPYLGMEFGGFRLGATYDVNTSKLKTASQSRGGLEISLIFTKRPPGYKGIPCPTF